MKTNTYLKHVMKMTLRSTIIAGVITSFFYALFFREENSLLSCLVCGFAVGSIIATVVSLYFAIIDRRFKKGSLLTSTTINSLFTVVTVFSIPMFLHMSFGMFNLSLSWSEFLKYVSNRQFYWGMGFGTAMCVIFIFFQEISLLIGPSTFFKFITGRYYHPREEKVVVMFLDINNSTAIAEKLGEVKFLSFVSDFFRDLSEALIITEAEIHKYVGDEAILMWKPSTAFVNNNCYECYFLAKEKIKRRTNYYMKKYGIVPDFKAGMHFGSVVFGEVGVLLKEIACLGDVLNTAARITSECRETKRPLLLSYEVASRLTIFSHLEHVGDVQLRGKEQTVSLYGVPASV